MLGGLSSPECYSKTGMESLSGVGARGEDATGPFQEEGYPVNSSCPSTSRALSIPEIRERIVDLAMSPGDKSTFCRIRAVGRAWLETTFELAKNHDEYCFWLPLSRDCGRRDRLRTTKKFLEKVKPGALWLPIQLVFDMNRVDVPLATRVAEDYSHIIVKLDLEICEGKRALSDLAQKLEVFQGRDYSRLQIVTVYMEGAGENPVEEFQKGLDAIERLTGSLTKLRHFHVTLWCDVGEEAQVILPSRITSLHLIGGNSLNIHPGNTLSRLQVLNVEIQGPSDRETNLRYFLEQCKTLEKLKIERSRQSMDEAPLPLFLPQMESLKEINLEGIDYVVETTTGSDVLPNLTTAELEIVLNLDEREVARMAALGKLFRKATRFELLVRTGLNASPRMQQVSECFSNVTTLCWFSHTGWETLVRPLSHVFIRMTTLQQIEIYSDIDTKETPIDLCRLLTGLQESQVAVEEKDTILNSRTDVLTNLCRLRGLLIRTQGQFQPLSPFVFRAVFNSMPELTKIELLSRSTRNGDGDLLNYVQDMVSAWRASGKLITTDY